MSMGYWLCLSQWCVYWSYRKYVEALEIPEVQEVTRGCTPGVGSSPEHMGGGNANPDR
jgi:hypothetical protein